MDALLVVDNPLRELRGLQSVGLHLEQSGLSSHICSKTNVNNWLEILKPSVVVLPRATSELRALVERYHKTTGFIVVPSEHGSGFEEKVLANAFGYEFLKDKQSNSAIHLVDKICVGGKNQRRWLAQVNPSLKDKIVVSGTLSSDHIYIPSDAKKMEQKVGISTTFKSLLLSSQATSPHAVLHSVLGHGKLQQNFWHLQFQNFELIYLSILMDLADHLLDSGFDIDIRPHPHEGTTGWQGYIKAVNHHYGQGRVAIDRSVDVSAWLDSLPVFVSSFSTMSNDAMMRGRPAISLENLVPFESIDLPSYKQPLRSDFVWKPNTVEEAVDLVRRAFRGELPVTPDQKKLSAFMHDNFDWPREQPAYAVIANEIAQMVRSHSATPRPKVFSRRLGYNFAAIFYKDIRDFFGPRRDNLLFSFLSRRLRADARKYAVKLADAVTARAGPLRQSDLAVRR